jgi:hypothetical protein
MADSMPAEIHIGGPVPAGLVDHLIATIKEEGIYLDWEGTSFDAETAADLLALAKDGGEPAVLRLMDAEAVCGEFDDLESFLVKHGVGFDRWSDARFEYDAELVQFRPGMAEPHRCTTNSNGEPLVPLSLLKPVDRALRHGHVNWAIQLLRRALAPEIPELEPLHVVEEDHALANHLR